MKGRNTPLDADLIETSYQLLRIPTTSSSSEEVERDTGVSLRIVNETFEVDMVVVQVQVQPNLSKQLERVKVAQAFYSDAV